MTDKHPDFVSGRLGDLSSPKSKSDPQVARNITNYGKGRLGFSNGTQPEAAPESTPVEAPVEPLDEPVVSSSAVGLVEQLREILAPIISDRRRLAAIATAACALVLGVVWVLARSPSDGPGPAPAAANSLIPQQKASVPAKPKSAAPEPAVAEKPAAPAKPPTRRELLMEEALALIAMAEAKRSEPEMPDRIEPTTQPDAPKAEPQPQPEQAPPAPKSKATTKPKPKAKKYRDCPSNLRLEGVIKTPNGMLVNINSRLLAVGDTVEGARIVTIRDFSVEMELKGEFFYLGMLLQRK